MSVVADTDSSRRAALVHTMSLFADIFPQYFHTMSVLFLLTFSSNISMPYLFLLTFSEIIPYDSLMRVSYYF